MSGRVITVTLPGTGMTPFPRSASGIAEMPCSIGRTHVKEFAASSRTFSRIGWFVRIERDSEYGSFVIPNPPRRTAVRPSRYVAPTRGANRSFCMATPRSSGTDPIPPISIRFVSRL